MKKPKTVVEEINFFRFSRRLCRKKLPWQWVVCKCSCKHLQKHNNSWWKRFLLLNYCRRSADVCELREEISVIAI